MSKTLRANTVLTRAGAGRYEMEAGPHWWGYIAQFGGYAMAVVLKAMTAELDRSDLRPRVYTHQFLRGMPEGRCTVEATVQRSGRGSGQVTARLLGGGKLCGTAMASYVADRPAPAFDDEQMPPVDPVGDDEEPGDSGVGATAHKRVRIYSRFDGGPRPSTTGGWIVPVEAEALTPELVLCYSDLWLPPAIGHADRSGAMFSFTHEAWLDVPSDATAPVLSRHENPRASGGLLDENINLWLADGRLVCRATQRRLYSGALADVSPPGHVESRRPWPQQGV